MKTLALIPIVLAFALSAVAEDAVQLQDPILKTTLACLGIRWQLTGDDNENAKCTVRFRRKGENEWHEAMALFRIHYKNVKAKKGDAIYVNALIGSVFHLAPGTAYEVELIATDPDGGSATKTVTATTRAAPRLPTGGRTLHVKPGELGSKQGQARPGDILLLHAGDHGKGVRISASGQPGRRIVFRAAGDGEVVFSGQIRITGSHVWIDGLTVRMSGGTAFNGQSKDVVITRCRVEGAHYCVRAYGHDWIVSDNVLIGDKRNGGGGHPFSGEGIEFKNRGHVGAFNDISYAADVISYGTGDIDVYNNRGHDMSDDLIEPDYAYDNYRVWHNRLWNGQNGFSFQPVNGGPWYIFENQLSGINTHVFKLREGEGPRVIVNNTFVSKEGAYTMNSHLLLCGIFSGNIWAQLGKARQLAESKQPLRRKKALLVDYNLYSAGGRGPWQFGVGGRSYVTHDLPKMRKLGMEKNSALFEGADLLTNLPTDGRKGTGKAILPKPGSKAIDAGTRLPNIAGPHLGKARDAGAYEIGLGTPWIGPRTWTSKGFGYGAPEGWKPVGVDKLRDYAKLGAPDSAPGADLLLVRERPAAFILVTFEKASGADRWKRFAETLDGKSAVRFHDGLGGRIARGASLIGARVETDGITHVLGGCARSDLASVQDDWFTFLRSLYHQVDYFAARRNSHVRSAPAASTARRKAGPAAPAARPAADPAAMKKHRAALIALVVPRVEQGSVRPNVFVEFLGRTTRARISGATVEALVVDVHGQPTTYRWEQLPPKRFYGIARRCLSKTSKQHVLALARYCAAAALTGQYGREREALRQLDSALAASELK